MDIQVRIRRVGVGAPAGKLADAEVHFCDGVLAGLKLVGFAVWARRDGTGREGAGDHRSQSTFDSNHSDEAGGIECEDLNARQ